MGQFNISDLSRPLSGLLSNFRDFLPGISQMLAIYYDPSPDRIICKRTSIRNSNTNVESLAITDHQGEIAQMRSERIPFTWMGKDDVPFEITEKKSRIDIFSELENRVLLLRVLNHDDNKYDLLFLYFDEQSTQFWLTGSGDPLDTVNKQIIGQLLSQSVGFYLNSMHEINKSLHDFKKLTRQSLSEYKTYKDRYDNTRSNYRKSIQNLSKHYLGKISAEKGIHYELSEDALQKLGEYSGDISLLENMLNTASLHADLLTEGDEKNGLIIHDWCIHFQTKRQDKAKEEVVLNRYDRTIHLLDRLEDAARIVVSQKLRLTGTNVGKCCDQPISAPAISDALKNHKSKIRYLAEQYPQKWPTIRHSFKPVINALEKNK